MQFLLVRLFFLRGWSSLFRGSVLFSGGLGVQEAFDDSVGVWFGMVILELSYCFSA